LVAVLAFDLLLGKGSLRSDLFGVFLLTGEDPSEGVAKEDGSLLTCRDGVGKDTVAAGGKERRAHDGQ